MFEFTQFWEFSKLFFMNIFRIHFVFRGLKLFVDNYKFIIICSLHKQADVIQIIGLYKVALKNTLLLVMLRLRIMVKQLIMFWLIILQFKYYNRFYFFLIQSVNIIFSLFYLAENSIFISIYSLIIVYLFIFIRVHFISKFSNPNNT